MVKKIDDLKKIIKDGYILQSGARRIVIRIGANNILRLHGRLETWARLQDLLANGEFDLLDQDGNMVADRKNTNWGGARVAGPGKKVGAPKKDPAKKKKPCSVSMSDETRDKLDALCEQLGKNRSEVIEMLIAEKS